MSAWITIGQYLLRRIGEAGVRHALGVPGDFNLNLMQQIEDGGGQPSCSRPPRRGGIADVPRRLDADRLLAAPQRRHLLLVGDGSFQLTAQEVSTILRHDLKPIIFLINNAGYRIGRTTLGNDVRYNDIANWAYWELTRVFRPDTAAADRRVETIEDFRRVLDEAALHDGSARPASR